MAKTEPAKHELMTQEFKALAMPAERFTRFLVENVGDQGLKPFDLDRVKVPAGGGTSWEVPSLKGPQNLSVLNGIVVAFRDVRSYWKEAFSGGSQPPDCQSPDGRTGIGAPGGSCAVCPLAQFGTAVKGDGKAAKGQACRQMRLLLFLREDAMLPMLVIVPPSSVKPAKQYFLRLAGEALPYYGVTTNLRLEKAKSGDGITYSQIAFSMGRQLEPGELERVSVLKTALQENFQRTTVDVTDVHSE